MELSLVGPEITFLDNTHKFSKNLKLLPTKIFPCQRDKVELETWLRTLQETFPDLISIIIDIEGKQKERGEERFLHARMWHSLELWSHRSIMLAAPLSESLKWKTLHCVSLHCLNAFSSWEYIEVTHSCPVSSSVSARLLYQRSPETRFQVCCTLLYMTVLISLVRRTEQVRILR